MYELPELEVIRAVIAEKYTGTPITKVNLNNKVIVGKKARFVEALEGATIWFVERRAGHLIFHLDSGKRLLLYVQQQTNFYGGEPNESLKLGAHLVLYFGNRYAAFYELAEEALQILTVREVDDLLKVCGPDPLEKRFSLPALQLVLSKKRSYLKTLLLDATIISGIGPIYSDEILYHAKISPSRKANTLTEEEGKRLYDAMLSVLKNAIADGGSRQQPLFAQDTFTGSYAEKLAVYNQEGKLCEQCNEPIVCTAVAKQKSYHCPNCQK